MDDNTDTISSQIDTEDVILSEEITTIDDSCLINNIINQEKDDKKYINVSKEDRITKNKLTMYEFVRIIGERTKQLTMGAKPLIKVNKNSELLEYNEIALEELRYNMIPFKIKRFIDNKYEIWELQELKKDHIKHLFN